MNALSDWIATLPALMALALIAWIVASARRNVGLVDIAWSLFFLLAASVLAVRAPDVAPRGWILITLVALWSLRLAAYLAIRNWNAPEDRRYRAIRARNEPGFAWKSLYLVFGLQALLAWLIAAPLAVALLLVRTLFAHAAGRHRLDQLLGYGISIVVTLALQSTTRAWLARRLGLDEP